MSEAINNKNFDKKGLTIKSILLVLVIITVIAVLEIVKQLFHADMNFWESILLTIIFSAIITVTASYFFLRKYHDLMNTSVYEMAERTRINRENIYNLSLLESTIESTADGILVVDNNGKVTKANKKFGQLWKVPDSLREEKDDDKLLAFVLDQLKDPNAFVEKVKELYEKPELESFDILEFKDGRIYERFSIPQKLGNEIKGRVWSFRDITERKRTEHELLQSEFRYRSIVEKASDIIYELDVKGNIKYVNPVAERLMKYSSDELIGKSFMDFALPEHRNSMKRVFFTQYLNKTPSIYQESPVITKDGEKLWMGQNVELIFENDEVVGFLAVSRDITKQKELEKILAESEKKYKDLFEKSEDANLIIIDGKFVDCNDATVKMLRYSDKKDLLEKHPSQLSPEKQPDGQSSFEKADQMMNIALEKGSHRYEWYNQKADGEVFPVEVLLTAVDTGGEHKILHTVWRDITESKLAEELLKRERILLRTVIDNIPDSIYAKDSDYRKTLSNKADLRYLGCEKEEDVIGKTDFDFFTKEIAESFYSDDQKIIRDGQLIINREESFFDKHGNVTWLLTSKIPLRDETGKISGLIGIGHDITSRRKTVLIQNALYEISEAAHNVSDMVMLYKRIHEVVGTLMPVKNFYIALYDEKTDLISFPYLVDEFEPYYEPKKKGKGLTEFIIDKGEAFLIDADMDLELRRTGETELVGTPSAIWLGVPLKVDGKTIGVLVVQDYENVNAYGEKEKDLLIFVSAQIALAIEKKRNSDSLARYAEELKELNQTKDRFFSIIAHDLKSPFQGLLGYSQILLEDYESLTEEEKHTLILGS